MRAIYSPFSQTLFTAELTFVSFKEQLPVLWPLSVLGCGQAPLLSVRRDSGTCQTLLLTGQVGTW